MAGGFLDRLAAMWADNRAAEKAADRRAARQRFEDFMHGEAIADSITAQVARHGTTYERNTATLRGAARQQPNTLAGRVAASRLSDAADSNEAATPDTQAEARRLQALSAAERIIAARAKRSRRALEREPEA